MASDPIIPRKWRLRAHNQQNVFAWGPRERSVHTVMKALIWALYLPCYPDLTVEVRAGDPRYKPDVVSVPEGPGLYTAKPDPRFWGEAGQVGREKIETLVRRYPGTHFALGKWDTDLRPVAALVSAALDGVARQAPFDLVAFPPDSVARFIGADGTIRVTHDDLDWTRL